MNFFVTKNTFSCSGNFQATKFGPNFFYLCVHTCSGAKNEDHLKLISELQSKLEEANAELVLERAKVLPISIVFSSNLDSIEES